MRLIDADKLKEAFAIPCYEAVGVTTICSIIDDAPTVDAEPVRHGKWLPFPEDWRMQVVLRGKDGFGGMTMTAKEAIGIINIAIAVVEWEYPLDYAAAFDEAVKALEKQVPKMPARSERETRYCEVWKCPHCGFEWSSRVVDYCYRCGQAIDWSEV